jgi:hypothetical protein
MAIDRIPGVGPANSDIAAAVAAPSAATIATAVAAAVPTTAGITSIVQSNASTPYAGTITNLGYQSGNGASTVTFSSLGGYKRVYVYWQGCDTTNSTNVRFRINGDTGANYAYTGKSFYSSQAPSPTGNQRQDQIYIISTNSGVNGSDFAGTLTLFDTNSGAYKIGKITARAYSGVTQLVEIDTLWASTAAITSISIYLQAGTFTTSGTAGFYAIGYN